MNNWESLDVALPELRYENLTVSGQGKGSTEFAAHSHTPIEVKEWAEFPHLIEETKNSQWAQQPAPFDMSAAMRTLRLSKVSKEEEVTNRTQQVLAYLEENFSNCEFRERSSEIQADPDLIAMESRDEELGVGSASEYVSPINRAATRRATVNVVKEAYRFPFETKPHWKFSFLNSPESNKTLIREWEFPKMYTPQMIRDHHRLPSDWSLTKKKVFHVVRQLYGQMVADHCRYGVLHTYEYWFFCKRTKAGSFHISKGFDKKAKSPSVMQCVMTLLQRSDFRLRDSLVHPQSARKLMKRLSYGGDDGTGPDQNFSFPRRNDNDKKLPPSEKGREKGGTEDNIAATLEIVDSTVFDVARNVSLLSNTMYPNVLIKMQKRGSRHVADEMEREARMYKELQKKGKVANVIPKFYGFSRHWGVPIICLEKEGDNFEDIGLENLSSKACRSALLAVQVLSDAGVLHNDLALRNFVVSRNDKNVAKVVDFGRATFSSNKALLREQVEEAKLILGI